jgi:acyl-CoA synthetase (AMP-forming)/AMP-acid ligase II
MSGVQLNLADVFECVADAVPEREALVCGDRRLTYADLEERANRLAHHLAAAGVGPGDHVACYLYNGTDYLETMLAAYKLRAVPFNVNWRYVADELRYLLTDADVAAVVYDPVFAATLDEVAPDLPELRTALAVGPEYEDAVAAAAPDRDFPPGRSPDDIYLLYTGGTTGMPKGVMWRHEDLIGGGLGALGGASTPAEVAERAREGGQRALPACPLMHGTAQWVTLANLLGGGTVVLSPDRRLDAARLVQLLAAERVNMVAIVGDAVGRPLADALEELAGGLDLSACKAVLSSGAFLSPPVKNTLLAHLPGARIHDAYGSSETGVGSRTVTEGNENPPPQGKFEVDGTIAVLGDDLRPVAPGSAAVGRVARSGTVALGYYNDPEATARTFPVIEGVRYCVTGDLATVEADGTITLLGRGSACINTGGEKVYPDEVEAALKSHPKVADAMVVGVPDERFGERVVALVQPRGGEVPPDLDDHVRRHVAGYKAPREIFEVDAVERFPSGKPDYAWGRATAASRREAARPSARS